MTTREKIIVSVMCLTIIYGAYELTANRRGKTAPPSLKTNSASDLKTFVAEVSRKVAGEKVAREYRYLIAQADTPWSKDPFLKSDEALKPSLAPAAPPTRPVNTERPPDFAYTGFLALGATRMAIVNGMEYSEGEALSVDDYYIKTIFPNRLVIGRIGGTEMIQLPIQEMDSDFGN